MCEYNNSIYLVRLCLPQRPLPFPSSSTLSLICLCFLNLFSYTLPICFYPFSSESVCSHYYACLFFCFVSFHFARCFLLLSCLIRPFHSFFHLNYIYAFWLSCLKNICTVRRVLLFFFYYVHESVCVCLHTDSRFTQCVAGGIRFSTGWKEQLNVKKERKCGTVCMWLAHRVYDNVAYGCQILPIWHIGEREIITCKYTHTHKNSTHPMPQLHSCDACDVCICSSNKMLAPMHIPTHYTDPICFAFIVCVRNPIFIHRWCVLIVKLFTKFLSKGGKRQTGNCQDDRPLSKRHEMNWLFVYFIFNRNPSPYTHTRTHRRCWKLAISRCISIIVLLRDLIPNYWVDFRYNDDVWLSKL